MLDITSIRKDFPVTDRYIYLDNGAKCALARPVYEALSAFYEDCLQNGRDYGGWWDTLARVRAKLAALINTAPEEIGFFSNATHAVNVVAQGMPWRRGDNIVVAREEFPSNLYPWLNLEERGVEVRLAQAPDGRLDLSRYEPLVDQNTRLIALSHVQAATGYRADLEQFGQFCAEREIIFFVDATQSCGVLPIDAQRCRIDYLCASTYKWLLATDGLAFLYGRREKQRELAFAYRGWSGRTEPNDYTHHQFLYPDSIRRFELGNHNYSAISALDASLDYLSSMDAGARCERAMSLTQMLKSGLREIEGLHLISDYDREHSGPLVAAALRGKDHALLHKHLHSDGVIASLKPNGVRFSPNFFNSEEEIQRALASVKACAGQGRL